MNRSGAPGIRAIDVWTALPVYYHAETGLAAGTFFIPVAGTIIMCALGSVAQKLSVHHGALTPIKKGADSLSANEYGYMGCMYCDGSSARYYNDHSSAMDTWFRGVSTG